MVVINNLLFFYMLVFFIKFSKDKLDHNKFILILVKTTGGTANGSACVFPFVYNKKKYSKCLSYGFKSTWCATVPNYDKVRTWGYCEPVGKFLYFITLVKTF